MSQYSRSQVNPGDQADNSFNQQEPTQIESIPERMSQKSQSKLSLNERDDMNFESENKQSLVHEQSSNRKESQIEL